LKDPHDTVKNRAMSEESAGASVPPENKSGEPRTLRRPRNPQNPATILLQFRDGHATDIDTLFAALGVYESLRGIRYERLLKKNSSSSADHRLLRRSYRSQTYGIILKVRQLIDAGLLQVDDPKDDELEQTKIGVTPLLRKIQDAMDLKLTSLETINSYGSMTVKPLFGNPGANVETIDVFVLMPFKADMLPVYEDHIKPTCASLGLTVRRGDDFFTAHSVVQDIWKAIVSARVIVADCTDRNPNVFYEIGLAHTIGTPTVLLTQRAEDIPFDLRHLRYIESPHAE
jgi:hypothetical protein